MAAMFVFLSNLLLLVLGLLFGSFVSALSYRYPRGKSVIGGRSFCDSCKKSIPWYDNIPLFSFLLLRGRCRVCRKKISLRYPVIEVVSAVSFLLIGPNILNLILFLILLTIFIVDFEHKIIPDAFVFLGIAVSLFLIPHSLFSGLFAGSLAASFLLFIHLITKGRGMGLGDVKFALLGGMVVGLRLTALWMLLAFLTGGAVGVILILGKKAGLKSQIAFGPFLVVAIPITLIWGEKILAVLGLL
jgi:leader peptidase (prepilin peptidase) / N-methyltransferase